MTQDCLAKNRPGDDVISSLVASVKIHTHLQGTYFVFHVCFFCQIQLFCMHIALCDHMHMETTMLMFTANRSSGNIACYFHFDIT